MLKLGGWPRLTWGRDAIAGRLSSPSGASGVRGVRSERLEEPSLTTQRRADAPPEGGNSIDFGPPRAEAPGRPVFALHPRALGCGAARCVTPRQACPRPGGLGRNLRSKTRWFAGFCNSHQVSHFATFFIDARAEISVAESRPNFISESPARLWGGGRGRRGRLLRSLPLPRSSFWVLGANRALGASVVRRARPSAGAAAGGSQSSPRPASSRCRGGRSDPPSRCVRVTWFAGLPSFGPRQ